MSIGALNSGLQGLQTAGRQFERSAAEVARITTPDSVSISAEARRPPGDLVRETVNTITAVAAYRANLKTIQTADDISGVLISLGSR